MALFDKEFIALIIALFSTGFVVAQSGEIKGRMVFNDGQAVHNAQIHLVNSEIDQDTLTDSDGYYHFSGLSKGKYVLTGSYAGYTWPKKKITLKADSAIVQVPPIVLGVSTAKEDQIILRAQPDMRIGTTHEKIHLNSRGTAFENPEDAWTGQNQIPFPEKNKNNRKDYDYYRLKLETSQEPSDDFVNEPGFSYELNRKHFQLYTRYKFIYDPLEPEGNVSLQRGNERIWDLKSSRATIYRNHQGEISINFDFDKNNAISLNNHFSYENRDLMNPAESAALQRKTTHDAHGHQFQFVQIWRHKVNDSVNLALGAHEVFKNSDFDKTASTQNQTPHHQKIKTELPVYIGFFNYQNKNNYGKTSAGIRFHSIDLTHENSDKKGTEELSSPHHYQEKVIAAYLKHQLPIAENKFFQLRLGTETSIIKRKFRSAQEGKIFNNRPRFTDLLYSIGYNWTTENGQGYQLIFEKSLKRPDYDALNPFQEIWYDMSYYAGELGLEPAHYYTLNFYAHKSAWTLHARAGYVKNFMTNHYEFRRDRLTSVYRNFENTYFLGTGLNYKGEFFDRWETNTSANLNYYRLKDARFNLHTASPGIEFHSEHTVDIWNDWEADLEFTWASNADDGLTKHHNYSQLDLSFQKKLGDHLTMTFFAEDLFKTDRRWDTTKIREYTYNSNINQDSNTYGVSFTYTLTGKLPRKQSTVN